MEIRENKIKNDYYVYFHKTLDGDIFYVGKGRNKRAWYKSNRSKAWKEVSEKGYFVEMHSQFLSEENALRIENELISTLPNLVNRSTFNPIVFNDYSEYFAYSPESPSGLVRIKGVFNGLYEKGKIGPCGHTRTRSSGNKFWAVKFKNKAVQVHRIIWQLVYGEIPDSLVVDHIDGDSLNNKIDNLRTVTKELNTRNRGISKNNSTGVNGVLREGDSFRATWRENDKPKTKRFSINKLGFDEAFKQACEWRKKMTIEKDIGYTERHGT